MGKDWELEAALSELAVFDPEKAKYELEQYATSAHLAAQIARVADRSFGDLEEQRVLDLGCGTGMLSCACALAGASFVLGIDADADALVTARANVEACGASVDFVLADAEHLPLRAGCLDVAVQNPPFGTRRKGADALFVRRALRSVAGAVYSLHKTSTRRYFAERAGDWGASVQVVAELRFDVPKMYKFHRDAERDIAVDLLRFAPYDPLNLPPPPPLPDDEPRKGGRGRGSKGRGRGKRR
mmetsp:Transcript_23372/g.70012  ORF Transcript_23372/g.70012 Transcript_23372/m.70012 type:complete len:242 (+) Transcript_23372:161-886(+)